MIDVIIDKQTYKMPESWEDINIKTYNKILDFQNNKTFKSDLIGNVHYMAMLIGCEPDLLMGLQQDNFIKLCHTLSWSNEEIKGKDIQEIEIKGIKYIANKDLTKLTVGEMVTLETIIADDVNDLAGIMSVILRPSVKRFNVEKNCDEYVQEEFKLDNYQYRKDLFFEELKITDVINISNFFLTGGKQSSEIMKDTSVKE